MRITMLILLLIVISEAQLNDPVWNQRRRGERVSRSSVVSAIKNMENIRRQIVDSSRNGRGINHDYSRDGGQSWSPDYPSAFFETEMPEEDNSFGSRRTSGLHPHRQVDTAMLAALSKLANVRMDNPEIPHVSMTTRRPESDIEYETKSYNYMDENKHKDFYKKLGSARTFEIEEPVPESLKISSVSPTSTRKFNCRAIRDLYIPKVDKKMPAYVCTHGKKGFVISSERFVHDRREYFEVNVDEETFRRLHPMAAGMTTFTSRVSVLPATLVLKQGEDGYSVRGIDENNVNNRKRK